MAVQLCETIYDVTVNSSTSVVRIEVEQASFHFMHVPIEWHFDFT